MGRPRKPLRSFGPPWVRIPLLPLPVIVEVHRRSRVFAVWPSDEGSSRSWRCRRRPVPPDRRRLDGDEDDEPPRGGDKQNGVAFQYGVDAPTLSPPIGGLRLVYYKTAEQVRQRSTPALPRPVPRPVRRHASQLSWFTSVEEQAGATVFLREVPFC